MTQSPVVVTCARTHRIEQTHAETLARVEETAAGWLQVRRQVPIDPYIADFCCIDASLIVELDGGQHLDQIAYDEVRTRHLEACGFQVLRFWNGDVLREIEQVVEEIRRMLHAGS